MSEVEWRTISANDHYEVSKTGLVRRRTKTRPGNRVGQILRGREGAAGYIQITLWREKKPRTHLVHRLVCIAFHGEPPFPRAQVAHADGTRTNNDSNNLRWTDAKGNAADRIAHGRQAVGRDIFTNKLNECDVMRIRIDKRKQRDIAADYEITQSSVWAIKARKTWKHVRFP